MAKETIAPTKNKCSFFIYHNKIYFHRKFEVLRNFIQFHLYYEANSSNLINVYSPYSPISLVKRQSCHHIETTQLICSANQLTGFYMMVTLAFNELILDAKYGLDPQAQYNPKVYTCF